MVHNKTLIVIAHKLSSIKHADNIVVINDGEIYEKGTHDALLENRGIYQELWSKRIELKSWKI